MKAIKLALGDLFNKGQFNCLHSKIFPCVIFEIMFPITESESIDYFINIHNEKYHSVKDLPNRSTVEYATVFFCFYGPTFCQFP